MMKWGLSAGMVIGFLMAIVGFMQYSSSGTEVARFDLKSGQLNQGQLQLAPDMNALRGVLATRFRNRSNNLRVTHYDYHFSVKDMDELVLVNETGSNFETYKETPSHHQRNSIRKTNHILDSWKVTEGGVYLWEVTLKPRQAELESAQLLIRQNVMTEFPGSVAAGAVLMIASLVLLIVTGRAERISG